MARAYRYDTWKHSNANSFENAVAELKGAIVAADKAANDEIAMIFGSKAIYA